jgi:hypothetical protein
MFGERTLAALMALLLLLTGVSPAVGATVVDVGEQEVADHDGPDDDWGEKNTTKAADEAYVTENGDVVLVYQYDNESDGDEATGYVSTNVSEGLAYLTLTDENASANSTGDVTVIADPNRIGANGTITAEKPESIEALNLSIEQLTDDTTSESSLDLHLAATPENDSETPDLESMTTSGFVESSAETITSNGSVTVDTRDDDGTEREHNYVLTEDEDGYELAVRETYEPEIPTVWADREAAMDTLEQRYCDFGSILQCSVTVEDYAFTDGTLDISYTVSLEGVKETIEGFLPLALSEADGVDVSDASRMAGRLTNVTVERIEADISVSGGTTTVTWNASVSGNDDLALAMADGLDILEVVQNESMDAQPMGMSQFGSSPGEMADQIRAQLAAQRASGVTGTVEWDASMIADSDSVEFHLSASAESDNWERYIDELETNNGTVPPSTDLAIDVETDGDDIVTEASVAVEKEGLFEGDMGSLEQLTAEMDDEEAEKVEEFLTAIENTDFVRARADMTWDGESAEIEAGMAANNASALTEPLPHNLSSVESTYTDLDERRTYVRPGGVLDGDATEEDVRKLALVNDSTDAHPARDWHRPSPATHTQYVKEYLGLIGDDDDGFPTMVVAGGAVAVTAAAGGLLLFNRLG